MQYTSLEPGLNPLSDWYGSFIKTNFQHRPLRQACHSTIVPRKIRFSAYPAGHWAVCYMWIYLPFLWASKPNRSEQQLGSTSSCASLKQTPKPGFLFNYLPRRLLPVIYYICNTHNKIHGFIFLLRTFNTVSEKTVTPAQQ